MHGAQACVSERARCRIGGEEGGWEMSIGVGQKYLILSLSLSPSPTLIPVPIYLPFLLWQVGLRLRFTTNPEDRMVGSVGRE